MQPALPAESELRAYYAQRAAEYERIYAKPERQADLAHLRAELPALFEDRRVLEIACGTGYWTPLIAQRARSVLATDATEETLAIARAKEYPLGNVRLELADACALPVWPRRYTACFAGFWWSHLPLQRLADFHAGLHARLEPGAQVVFLDNRYVPGNSTPLAETDAHGNTYQRRQLGDGSVHRVLKNYPEAAAACAAVAPWAEDPQWSELRYYWTLRYRVRA